MGVEMLLVDQTMSYINYELLIEWFWQRDMVTSSPESTELELREFARETVSAATVQSAYRRDTHTNSA